MGHSVFLFPEITDRAVRGHVLRALQQHAKEMQMVSAYNVLVTDVDQVTLNNLNILVRTANSVAELPYQPLFQLLSQRPPKVLLASSAKRKLGLTQNLVALPEHALLPGEDTVLNQISVSLKTKSAVSSRLPPQSQPQFSQLCAITLIPVIMIVSKEIKFFAR